MKGRKREFSVDIILHEDLNDEDWIRAGRRRFLLLTAIYYMQHILRKNDGVTLEEIRDFLERLKSVD